MTVSLTIRHELLCVQQLGPELRLPPRPAVQRELACVLLERALCMHGQGLPGSRAVSTGSADTTETTSSTCRQREHVPLLTTER